MLQILRVMAFGVIILNVIIASELIGYYTKKKEILKKETVTRINKDAISKLSGFSKELGAKK